MTPILGPKGQAIRACKKKRRGFPNQTKQEMKMRKSLTMTLVALSLVGSLTAASAQAFDRSQAKQQESSQPSTPSNATDRGYLAE